MLSTDLLGRISKDDALTASLDEASCFKPDYRPERYFEDVASRKYFNCLAILRHYVKAASDEYFSVTVGAKNVDLFMLTPSISSPMGPGSNSEPVPIQFGSLHTYLVDSSQFGFEPLMINGIERAYCYLPSMRGEDPDARHLNQFYHCEYEGVGVLEHVMQIVEGYVRALPLVFLNMPNVLERISQNPEASRSALTRLSQAQSFRRIRFADAITLLEEHQLQRFVNYTPHGKDISAQGELALLKILKTDLPVWITHFDRDRVPFYQKPDPENTETVLNADLLFPPLVDGAFGGEVVGSGQRQDTPDEMYESMRRQDVSSEPYEWYAELRRMPNYRITSGFGMGIERLLAWALCIDNVRDVILYPRLKNVRSLP